MKNYEMSPASMNTVLSIEQLEKSFVLHTQNGAVLKGVERSRHDRFVGRNCSTLRPIWCREKFL